MSKLLAWFPQAGCLPVKIPEGLTPMEYRDVLIGKTIRWFWVELEDGSYANLYQIVRLEIAS